MSLGEEVQGGRAIARGALADRLNVINYRFPGMKVGKGPGRGPSIVWRGGQLRGEGKARR